MSPQQRKALLQLAAAFERSAATETVAYVGDPREAADLLRSLAEETQAEPVAWISTVQCIGPEFGKKRYDSVPIQSLQPGYYTHTPLYTHPPAKQEPLRECGWIAKDGFPALLGNRPLKPGAKLYANPADFHGEQQ